MNKSNCRPPWTGGSPMTILPQEGPKIIRPASESPPCAHRRIAGSIRRRILCAFLGPMIFLRLPLAAADSTTTLWFDAPATSFHASLPLGNGRIGAMVFGGVDEERIVLNESSVWSGSREDSDRANAHTVLPEIRRLLLEGKIPEAEALVNANFTCQGKGSGRGRGANVPFGCYQVLGNLHLQFAPATGAVESYRRELDLATAAARLSFKRDGVTWSREHFVSAPDEVFVSRLTADR
ncbi:MAG: glycoside hydrolase family 95 protein, partial [Verrucomicrobia bacterium]|nr:glycoside hydrolase family 95 protein [Verrucomicrobiota bacterium]